MEDGDAGGAQVVSIPGTDGFLVIQHGQRQASFASVDLIEGFSVRCQNCVRARTQRLAVRTTMQAAPAVRICPQSWSAACRVSVPMRA